MREKIVRGWMSCVRADLFVPSYGTFWGLLDVTVVLEKERLDLASEQLGQIHSEAAPCVRPPTRSLRSDMSILIRHPGVVEVTDKSTGS